MFRWKLGVDGGRVCDGHESALIEVWDKDMETNYYSTTTTSVCIFGFLDFVMLN